VLTLAHALSDGACPVVLHAGDLALADRYTALLHRHTRDHALDVWHTYADSFRGQILVRTGHPRTGLAMLRDAIDKLSGSGFVLFRVPFLAAFAEALLVEGRHGEALSAVGTALAACEGSGEGWAEAELWRLRGEILLSADGMGVAETAGDLFRRAMGIAREQKALSWELRAATSAARLLLLRGRVQEAADLLAFVRGRLKEGFGTADVLAADAVLAEARVQAPP
jgi:hypothetical protein